jgi:cytoskeletal protein RodZ
VDKIKTQANKVGELVFAADTGATYQKALALTWSILRETGLLLWLVLCLVFVGGEWFWKNSVSVGRKARSWYEDFQTPSTPEESKSAAEMGQSALAALSTSAETLLYKAKTQLGMDAEPPAPKAPTPPPAPVTTPAATSTAATTAGTGSAPAETKSAMAAAAEKVEAAEKSPVDSMDSQSDVSASDE